MAGRASSSSSMQARPARGRCCSAPDGACLGTEQQRAHAILSAGRAGSSMTPRKSGAPASPARGRWSSEAGGAERIAAIGITNQRETIVFWSAARPASRSRRRSSGRTGAPPSFARGSQAAGHEEALQAKTGLLLDPYFSATKIAWALDNWPAVREAGEDLCVGTVESLAGLPADRRAPHHRRDQRLAHRADGYPRRRLGRRACSTCGGVPRGALPEIVDCAGALRRHRCRAFRRADPARAAWPATSRRRRSARPA